MSEYYVADVGRRDIAAIQDCAYDCRPELAGRHVLQAAAEVAHGTTAGAYDKDILHLALLKKWRRQQRGAASD
jgi:hypothetical protein